MRSISLHGCPKVNCDDCDVAVSFLFLFLFFWFALNVTCARTEVAPQLVPTTLQLPPPQAATNSIQSRRKCMAAYCTCCTTTASPSFIHRFIASQVNANALTHGKLPRMQREVGDLRRISTFNNFQEQNQASVLVGHRVICLLLVLLLWAQRENRLFVPSSKGNSVCMDIFFFFFFRLGEVKILLTSSPSCTCSFHAGKRGTEMDIATRDRGFAWDGRGLWETVKNWHDVLWG